MTDRTKNVLDFGVLQPAESASLPHGLNLRGTLKLTPDVVWPEKLCFEASADDTEVTVTNRGKTADSVRVSVEWFHSLERALGKGDGLDPFQPLCTPPFSPFYCDEAGGAAVTKRSLYLPDDSATSSSSYVDGCAGLSIAVPFAGKWFAEMEGECENQSAATRLSIGISVNSTSAVIADSIRDSQGPASNLRPAVTSTELENLQAGDLVRLLFKKLSGPGQVTLHRRRLTLIQVEDV